MHYNPNKLNHRKTQAIKEADVLCHQYHSTGGSSTHSRDKPNRNQDQEMATDISCPIEEIFSTKVLYIDPSEHYRPEGKPEEEFRYYSETDVSICTCIVGLLFKKNATD